MNQPAFSRPVSPGNLHNDAWIGDAVLLLYARDRILRENGELDNAACVRMTSNRFLASLGEPSRVEAEIGRLYKESGWAAAVEWIETWLMPLFAKQEENRLRKRTSI